MAHKLPSSAYPEVPAGAQPKIIAVSALDHIAAHQALRTIANDLLHVVIPFQHIPDGPILFILRKPKS